MAEGRIERIALAGWRGMRYLEFTLDEGPFTGLVGEPGAGKSTVAMILCNALLPDRRYVDIRPLSSIEDVHKVGVDTLAGRIEPTSGYAYILMDVRLPHDARLVAGFHAAVVDGKAEFTRLVIEDAPLQWPLQDFLRAVEGDQEYYPDHGELMAHLARQGVSMRICRTVREYGELLNNAGILPCDYSDNTERFLFGKLLESTFRGGVSQEVASRIKSYMLPAATRVPESVSRLQQCADTVLRTKNSLAAAEQQLALLEATYGLGKAIVTRALRQCAGERVSLAHITVNKSRTASEAQATIDGANRELNHIAGTIETTAQSKSLLEDEFKAKLETHELEQRAIRAVAIERSGELSDARRRVGEFNDGRSQWMKFAGVLAVDFDIDRAHAAMVQAGQSLMKSQTRAELQLEADSQTLQQLLAGFGQSASGALADILGVQSLAEALDEVPAEDARALEIALGGIVEGVIGVDLDALTQLKDDETFPDTFWLRTNLPDVEPLRQVGDWYAMAKPGGYIVTSKRRRLALGRHAREREIARLEGACEAARKSIKDASKARSLLQDCQNNLLSNRQIIQVYLDFRLDEHRLEQELDRATRESEAADVKVNAGIAVLGELNAARTERTRQLEEQLAGLDKQKRDTEGRRDTAEKTLEASRNAIEEAQARDGELQAFQREALDSLSGSASWLHAEAERLPLITHDDYLTVQTRAITDLGHALQGEELASLEWLGNVQPADVVSCASIWMPLRSIVSDRVSVEVLEDDSSNLISSMRERRRNLDAQLAIDRAQMRAEAKSLYSVISTEIRKQDNRIKRLSAFGEALQFGKVTGMRITMDVRKDWLEHLQRAADQIDMFATSDDQPLDQKLAALFEKALNVKLDGMALLDYRTYVDLTIEAQRQGEWKAASGLSGAESIGGGLAVSLMLMRSLAHRSGEGRPKPFTPIFIVDEVQRMNADGQGLLVEFGRRQGFQVLVTALDIQARFPCTLHVMDRYSAPEETVVSRQVRVTGNGKS
ncbi:ATP-binding cassette domain-containing protein [Rhodoferax sp. U11-2br]|uniref:ATP-binding cassette domain-containing protein n=1 Tax=Rhodoferax sp. U11-2br TaxID=2838878 RepID=UPI001BECBA41|nr:ATP-binding cassette domain-containing protein [Rhodoferax sp. U11-2br]MBT3066281.1 hypothetical protein [Rhodoferax sp. U11-2br]